MPSAKWLWRSCLIASGLALLLCLTGFAYAVRDVLLPPSGTLAGGPLLSAPSAGSDPASIEIVTLGDSLTKGTGDQTGKGYVGHVQQLLSEQSGKPVHILGNYGVNGYTTAQLLADLQTQQSISQQLSRADVILMTIGGNDLYAIGRNLFEENAQEEIDPNEVKARMPEPLRRLEQIFGLVAQANPQATFVYVSLYNPFYDLDPTGELSAHVAEWNRAASQAAAKHPNMMVVPTFDLFQANFAKYIYSDHFHPNQQGYEAIAERIVQTLP